MQRFSSFDFLKVAVLHISSFLSLFGIFNDQMSLEKILQINGTNKILDTILLQAYLYLVGRTCCLLPTVSNNWSRISGLLQNIHFTRTQTNCE